MVFIGSTNASIPRIALVKQASPPPTPASGFAMLFVDNATPTRLKYIDDAGNIRTLEYSGGAGSFADLYVTASLRMPNGAGGTTVNDAGEITTDTTSRTLNFYDGAAERVLNPVLSRSITLEAPSAVENSSIFHTDKAITITKVIAVVQGSSSPSVTIQIKHGTDRSAAGTSLFSSGQVITSTTTGSSLTSFASATVVANAFIWLTTSAKSGTVNELHATIYYTIDP
jgi:hypothetical protein